MEYDVGISSRKKEKGTGREMGMFQKKKQKASEKDIEMPIS